jgi:4-amino-4-deoxy-L-arabinose transferase-like glycosyltransferase
MLDSETVETVSSAPNIPAKSSPAARIGWAVLILVTLYVCYFSHLGAIGFVGPDEPRYAWIARDMAETGDWVTPRLYGKPWFEKPPLFYWGAALSFRLFGVSEAAARLPSAISAFLATLALAWLALRFYGAETARWLLLLLPTTVGMIGFSHAAATDMPFSAMLTVAMVCAAVALGLTRNENSPIIPQTPWLALLLFGFFLGLAVLAKGPAAIILSGGAVFFWAAFTKRWRDAFRLLHPAAIASFCITAFPWYTLCARRNPDFFRIFIIEHNFKRYLTPEFQHIQPLWFYVPVLLIAFLPWTGLLLWSAYTGAVHLWHTRTTRESTWLLICWAGFSVVFFSAAQSKLPGYVLPAIPAISLIISHQMAAVVSVHRRFLRLALLSMGLILIVLSAIVKMITPGALRGYEAFGIRAGIVLALMAAANFILALLYAPQIESRKHPFLAGASVAPFLFAMSVMGGLLSSYFHWDPSGRTLSKELIRRAIPATNLAVANMSRGTRYSLSFYLRQEVADWDGEHPQEGYLLLGSQSCKRRVPPTFECEQVPFDSDLTGRFLYKISLAKSAGGLAGSGELEQKK